jgi:hypothetical protein
MRDKNSAPKKPFPQTSSLARVHSILLLNLKPSHAFKVLKAQPQSPQMRILV